MDHVAARTFVSPTPAANRQPTDADADAPLILVALVLMAFGLVMVASTTASIDRSILDGAFWQTTFGRQAAFVGCGVAIMLAVANAAPPFLRSQVWRTRAVIALMVLAALGLAGALIPGLADPHQGSHRWIRVGPPALAIRYQPSELAKIALTAFLAWVLTRPGIRPTAFREAFLPAAAAIALCVALVGGQDFGTAALLGTIGMSLLVVAGCNYRHLAALAALGAAGMAVLLVAFPYRLARITAFLNYRDDPLGDGYQAVQSLAAIASGGWLGQGLGAGIRKYGYVPASHTDFVFSVICEETGALGATLVIALFCVLIFLGYQIAARAASPFERLLAFGLIATIGLQAAINIAVVTVVAPTKGISLPLLSAGGSGILTTSLALGLLAAIAKNSHRTASCEA